MLFFVKFIGNGSWSGSDNDGQYFATILEIDGGGVRGIGVQGLKRVFVQKFMGEKMTV
jgi:hypothetical protein